MKHKLVHSGNETTCCGKLCTKSEVCSSFSRSEDILWGVKF